MLGSRGTLGAVVAAHAVLALTWCTLNAPLNAPDEPTHLDVVVFVAEHGRQPIAGVDLGAHLLHRRSHRAVALDDPIWRSRPADYALQGTYASLPAGAYWWAAGFVRLGRPLGLDPLYAARLASAVATSLAVLFLGLTARSLWPGRPELHLLVPAAFAFLPQLVFVGAYVNSDAWSVMAGTGAFAALAHARRRRDVGPWVLVGLGLGAVLLGRLNGYGVAVAIGLGVPLLAPGPGQSRLRACGIVGGVALALVLPNLVHNLAAYGEPFGNRALYAELEAGAARLGPEHAEALGVLPPPRFRDLTLWKLVQRGWFRILAESFIGNFGWMSARLPRPLLGMHYALAVLALLGLVRRRPRLGDTDPDGRRTLVLLAVAALLLSLVLAVYNTLAHTWQAQGRYLFPAATGAALAWALGLTRWTAAPARRARLALVTTAALGLSCVGAAVWYLA